MHIVHVYILVKPEHIEAFKQATIENAQGSVQEPGVARFDAVQHADEPARFILIEHYKTPDDQLKHRETAHYLKWRDTVAEMMAEPRVAVKVVGIYPEV
jgi:quinol monooxygenase YgiN